MPEPEGLNQPQSPRRKPEELLVLSGRLLGIAQHARHQNMPAYRVNQELPSLLELSRQLDE
jgi:hypothetical protein